MAIEEDVHNASGFWHFSLDRYSRPKVSATCLQLQDKAGLDVNLLLFCLWCGQNCLLLNSRQIRHLLDGDAGHWHQEVVKPLRAARRAMKSPPPALPTEDSETLRSELKRVEIEAERLEQFALAGALPALFSKEKGKPANHPPKPAAMQNVLTYLSCLNQKTNWQRELGILVDTTIDTEQ
ncbi:MAG: TIGR02444 family protein [Nitratireductor sp.]|nr:TIGR02444 family protein [Nitratireductor sp.]